jgi:predicted branched-subunit amino acid permease
MSDSRPFMVALAPVGMALGAAVSDSPLSGAPGWLAGPLLLSGTAQFAIVTATVERAGTVAAVLMAWALSTRLMLFSASLAPRFRDQPRWFRLVGAHFLIDQTFVLVEENVPEDTEPDAFRGYWLGATLPIALLWVTAISVGMELGPVVPGSWRLDLAGAVLIAAMLRPALSDRTSVIAAALAAGATYGLGVLPGGVGLLAGAAVGMAAGAASEHRSAATEEVTP